MVVLMKIELKGTQNIDTDPSDLTIAVYYHILWH